MSDTAIRVSNLGKQYRLGGPAATYTTFREALVDTFTAPVRWLKGERKRAETFWALDDISFEIKQGEAVGIIGRNGAGKSTLLKILSRVTRPTRGKAELFGRVGSLLEVGTGFHTELTGRENIYLNGAILGMSRSEIVRKFDEIVDFSGVEKFLDTPVKFYSSGMYVRLAFAVAAHLEPEILVVDEVLAVGDAEFQKKCMGKMSDVAHAGRTVLFVSHNMVAIQNLCERSILLDKGQICLDATTEKAITQYSEISQEHNRFLPDKSQRTGDQIVKIENFRISPNPPKTGNPVDFIFELNRKDALNSKVNVDVAVAVLSGQYAPIFQLYSRHMGRNFSIKPGKSVITVSIDSLPLVPGDYHINLWLGSGAMPIDWIQDCFTLSIESGFFEGGEYVESKGYPVLVKSNWTIT
jgi:lipopolysaccharide transport system ATP-binding protein